MYAVWTKLTLIEDVLLGNATEVVDYLRTNFYSPMQQIHSMFSERAEQLQQNSSQEITNDSLSFRILHEKDFSFDSMCDYLGLIIYSYNGKSEFILNGQQYKRGDILIKDVNDISNSSSILKLSLKNQQGYNNRYESLLNCFFKKTLDKRFIGLGILYHQNKWKFNAFIFNSESNQSPFSLDEHRLLEMYILTWSKNINDQLSIHDNARKMLTEQFNYVKDLLETQRPDMEGIWASNEIDLAIKAFEYEIRNEITALFQTRYIFNTFSNIRDQIQSKNENKLQLIAEIFEHRRLTLKTQPSPPLLCQVWKQLKTVENWLHENNFNSIINFLDFNTFTSIESLFSIPVPSFLDQSGICPESDPFDPTLNYIGLLIYLYNDQDEFILNKHSCKRGQILIRQKENLNSFISSPRYKQTSFKPLFIHEYLYEWYFNEKPNEFFQGIAFIYEQNKWKFDVITYSGIHGIHSTYDIRGDNLMSSSINEQHSIDLALSTLYINNKWQEKLGCMYTIDQLEIIGRDSFRKEIEIIEKLFQTNLTIVNKTCRPAFNNFIDQYRPEPSVKPFISKKDKIIKRLSSQDNRESVNNSKDVEKLINSESNGHSKKSSKFYQSVENLATNSSQVQLHPTSPNSSLLMESKKPRTSAKPIAFANFRNQFRTRSSSQDSSSPSHHSLKPNNPIDRSDDSLQNHKKSHRSDSVSTKKTEPITLYQLWRELCDAEQKILHNSELTEFINYLTKKDYMNYGESIRFIPPDDKTEEYILMAKIKIDAQLQFLSELFLLKKPELLQQQLNQDKKQLEELFKAFEKHYIKQIEIAKKHSK